jgi:hypothetical protein
MFTSMGHSVDYKLLIRIFKEELLYMNIKLIRNATIVVEYAGKKILVDPILAEKGAYPPFPNATRHKRGIA